jgi:hypothetical protein
VEASGAVAGGLKKHSGLVEEQAECRATLGDAPVGRRAASSWLGLTPSEPTALSGAVRFTPR